MLDLVATWKWRTTAEGFVEVQHADGDIWERITLPGPNAQTQRTETWLDRVTAEATARGVPVPWVLGVIYAESGGDPHAYSGGCCAGLMQLSLKVYKLTLPEALDPDVNIALGVKTYARFKTRVDLPTAASLYNAGDGNFPVAHTNKASVWGMAEDMPAVPWTGYIEKVVRASNWWTDRLATGALQPPLPGEIPPPIMLPALSAQSSPSNLASFPVILLAGVAVGYGVYKLADSRAGQRWLARVGMAG